MLKTLAKPLHMTAEHSSEHVGQMLECCPHLSSHNVSAFSQSSVCVRKQTCSCTKPEWDEVVTGLI